LFAKKNILHFQVPFQNVNGRSWRHQLKLRQVSQIICNSQFTKRFTDQEFGVKSQVVYPPVGVENFQPGEKENLILSVARFSQSLHAKKQEVLIDAFRKLRRKHIKDWQLILAGGLRSDQRSYFRQLKKQTSGLPIRFMPNLTFSQLQKIYGRARIFWHAAGFGEDENQHPERMEHFGIVVVEAMAAGVVPVVIGRGGIPEIVSSGQDGFLWQTEEELVEQTRQLIETPDKMKKVAEQAIKSSQRFSEETFCQRINEII